MTIFYPYQLSQPTVRRWLRDVLASGGIIAYPSEGVYGFGCLAHHEAAVKRLVTMKLRDPGQGLIVVAADWRDTGYWLRAPNAKQQAQLAATWPGAVTWLMPTTTRCPTWVRGRHRSVALRVSAHPVVAALCGLAEAPLISTSANVHGGPTTREAGEIVRHWGSSLAAVIAGPCGDLAGPTPIFDLETGCSVRSA